MADIFSKNKKLKNDIILVVVIVVIATTGLLLINTLKKTGKYAVVKVDGKTVCSYSLNENRKEIISYEKDYENVLVIKDREVFIESANCKDKICVKHKKIKSSGESIVCLPHKLVIEITQDAENDNVDVVV